jgi:3-hydroxyacyl-CoA dehydrogenase
VASSGAKLGLPEVLIGLIPGAGGTQRLPRLVGVEQSLEIMVSGRPVSAAKALAMGLVDEVVEGGALDAAVQRARHLAQAPGSWSSVGNKKVNTNDISDSYYDDFKQSIAKKTRGQIAPSRIVEAVKGSTRLPLEDGLKLERDLFLQCMKAPESKALQHVFFSERAAPHLPSMDASAKPREIKKIAVIGAGTMGGGIAMNFASRGIPVRMMDVDAQAIERGMAVVRSNYARGIKRGKITEAQLETLMGLFEPSTDYAALADVDLVIEAVFEDMDLKKRVFSELDRHCKPGAILATNTSTLDVDEIAAITQRPADVVGLHFFSPANIMRLLEIVRGAETSDPVMATVIKLAKHIGKVGVISGVCYGFIGNRMLEGYARESGLLLLEGASPEQIDRAIFNFGLPMGPMAMGDLAGIDVGARVREERRKAGSLPDDPRYGVIADKLNELGRFGQKTGRGFYRYERGTRTPLPDAEVDELISPLINEGARILDEGIALRPGDIDVVWIFGYGFPAYRGGPMYYADQLGLDHVYERICHYSKTLGNEFGYWTPSPLLERLAKEGKGFLER